MKEDHEVINDEELKRFFLNEALLLCPSARLESGECEKLWILRSRLKRMDKLLGLLHNQPLEVNFVEMQEVFGFFFVEKTIAKKRKHLMNEHLSGFGQFASQLTRYSDLIAHYCLYSARHLRALERVMSIYFPEEYRVKQKEEIKQQKVNVVTVETEK